VIPCPVCSMPMPPRTPWGHQRITCSRSCGISQGNTKRRARSQEVDEVAVIRLIDGSPVHSTKAERFEAMRVLTERGYSLVAIASRLHTTPRSVSRYRAELHRREVAA
jgi:predicted nucleic acid-binding Zn ribbon protein